MVINHLQSVDIRGMMLQVVPNPLFFDIFIRVPSVDFDEISTCERRGWRRGEPLIISAPWLYRRNL